MKTHAFCRDDSFLTSLLSETHSQVLSTVEDLAGPRLQQGAISEGGVHSFSLLRQWAETGKQMKWLIKLIGLKGDNC